ncbi:MAG: hypothetical protein Q8O71_03900 [bacterium]|nr:hypothetical protein [bacterium]
MSQDNISKKQIDPNKIKIGDVILVASGTKATIVVQHKLGYGESSKWTHVAGSMGGYDLVEGQIPQSRVCNLQKDYVDKGIEIRVVRKNYIDDNDRIKVTLWWATMNNIPYDKLQLLWFPIAAWLGKILLYMRNIFNSRKRLICSELIANGFYKEGYNLFNKLAENVLPADYDNQELFNVVNDVWLDNRV